VNERAATNLVSWLICPAFLGLAAFLAFSSPRADIPMVPSAAVSKDQIVRGPLRTPLLDPSKATVAGVVRPCSECHKLFAPPPVADRAMMQHKDIVMRHGINTRCLNCHDSKDRDKLALHDGSTVTFDQAPRLCSQCHGTVYRDWQKGIHGKTLGSWDPTTGAQRRIRCVECHDPHAPAYKPMAPLPGPNTLRMGDQARAEEGEHRHVPLRRWSTGEGAHKPEGAPPAQQAKPAQKEPTP